jgi:hypothetical protein
MKALGFFLGAGSSIVYAVIGIIIFWTEVHWSLPGDQWMFTLAVLGFLYTFLQGVQVITMKLTGLKSGLTDIGLSAIPGGVLLLGVFTGHGEIRECVLYGAPVVIDLGIFLTLTMRNFQLTSDVSLQT